MRIVVNALSAVQGGGQNYVVELLSHLPRIPTVSVLAVVPQCARKRFEQIADVTVHAPRFPSTSVVHRTAWERWRLPRLLRAWEADVLFCPGGSLITPRPPACRAVVTFQNVLPLLPDQCRRYPRGYIRARLAFLGGLLKRGMARADSVIFISRFGRDLAAKQDPGLADKSTVIYHGISERFRRHAAWPARLAPGTEYILYTSILDVYKCQVEVIEAYHRLRQLRETREHLMLAGPAYPPYERRVMQAIRDLKLVDWVHHLGDVPIDELPGLYQHAKLFVFASLCENCPTIVLEAMASSVPMALSNRPPMPELAGNAALYFDPQSSHDMASCMARLLDDAVLAHELVERARRRSMTFSWDEASRQTLEVLTACQ
jgi:glycosyltransferase involved in cell wall biosynthesis